MVKEIWLNLTTLGLIRLNLAKFGYMSTIILAPKNIPGAGHQQP